MERAEHLRKGLCFTCHECRHLSSSCFRNKKHETIALVVEDGAEENDDNDKEIQVSTIVMNMQVEHEPMVVQLKGYVNSNQILL